MLDQEKPMHTSTNDFDSNDCQPFIKDMQNNITSFNIDGRGGTNKFFKKKTHSG